MTRPDRTRQDFLKENDMGCGQNMQDLIIRLANLFGDVTDRGELDAADFVDESGEIWSLRERAREIVESME